MRYNKLIETLEGLGLSANESAVYCAALSLGPSTIAEIARTANLKRTTVYSVIESLGRRGLMNTELTGWKKLFAAESPDRLEAIVESQRHKLLSVLPDFSALYKLKGSGSFIKYYEGLEAVKNVYEGMIRDVRPHEDYCIVSDCKRWYDVDEKYFEDFSKRRAKLPINIRLLLVENEWGHLWRARERELNFKVKYLPKGTDLATNLVFIPRRVLIQQLTNPVFAMVIENGSIIQMFRELFEILWRTTPEV